MAIQGGQDLAKYNQYAVFIVLCYLDPIIDTEICLFTHLYMTVEQHTLCTVVPMLMNTCIASSPHILMIIHWTYCYVISFTAQERTETHVNPHQQFYLYLQILLLTFWSRGCLEKLYFHLVKKCPPNIMEPEVSVPCLQKPITCS